MSGSLRADAIDGIAIVGLEGRFPGARNVDTFWRNVRDGVESVTQFNHDALRAAGVADSLLNDPNYVKSGAILSDMDAGIAALGRRRHKTKQIKQGMMQALLTGRVRLINQTKEAG